ncbi:MAG TPA: phosphate ABC transporter permease subunit PstC [Phycisphaerae bacterium]|nr:phosphate ABC transporter permease subunit PstC [Phycisphaerae bacterium]
MSEVSTRLPPPPPSPVGPGRKRKRSNLVVLNFLDGLTYVSTLGGALLMFVLLGVLAAAVFMGALPSIREFGLGFLTTTVWNPVTEKFGALPVIYGTLATSVVALLISVPISMGSAIFLVKLAPKIKIPLPSRSGHFTFYSPRGLVTFTSFLIELLAAIPSIAYGLWGVAVLLPFMQMNVQPWAGNTLGRIPWVGGLFMNPGPGSNVFTASVVLSIMVTPIMTAIIRDVLTVAPPELEQGALGLGATWWQAMRLILGYSRLGILGAVILGFARAIGETMAVTMVIGGSMHINKSLFEPGQTIASLLANQFAEADTPEYTSALVYAAFVLLVITTLINGVARVMVMRVTMGKRK